jgi:hypothetical protein
MGIFCYPNATEKKIYIFFILSLFVSDSIIALNMPKKIVAKYVVEVVLKHCISLDLKLHGQDIVYCKYCDNVVTGGFYRFACHLTGKENVEACEGVGDEVKKEMLEILTTLKEIHEEGYVGVGEKRKGGKDGVGRNRESFKRKRGCSQDSVDSKESLSEEACRAVARFFYNNAIPVEMVESDEFKTMCDLVSRHGVGFKPPSFFDIGWKYFPEDIKLTNEVLEEHRAMWKITGCSIMVDVFTNFPKRNILNLLVNSPKGTFFLKTIDASDMLESSEKLFKMMDDVVEEVGEENVVHVVTEYTPYYVAAAGMLMAKRTRLYWTPCATHCIGMMLQHCGEIPIHKATLMECQRIVSFIYSEDSLRTLLLLFTKGIYIWKVGITIHDSVYLTLCCLHENKGALIRMFKSKEWKSSEFAKTMNGKYIEDAVLHKRFWKNVMICYKGIYPILEVLRLVNSIEKPTMGFIYEAMVKAIEEIQRSFSEDDKERER